MTRCRPHHQHPIFLGSQLCPTFRVQLLAIVPRPVKAVVLLFPLTDDFKDKRNARYAQKLEKVGKGHIDPKVIWIKQTVRLGPTIPFSY